MHLLTKIENRDGIYHVRLYSVPARNIQVGTANGPAGSMPCHLDYLKKENPSGPTEFDESLALELGSRRVAIDGQFLLGKPDYSTWKLTLKSDPQFFELVNECRKLDRELWCEVVLEQPVTDCPPLKAHEVYYPRKKRVFFWGKLLRHDTKGKASTQAIFSEGADKLIRFAYTKHRGNLELTFTHWLKVTASEEPHAFLNAFRGGYAAPEENFSWGTFLYELIKYITPVPFFAIADERLITKDAFGDGVKSISRGNLQLRRQFNGDTLTTRELNELESPIRKNSAYTALFEYDPVKLTSGQYSLFQWKDLAQGIHETTREFFKRFQVELPCMDDYAGAVSKTNDNTERNRGLMPSRVARWLFTEVRSPKKRLHFTSRSDTVEYQPAALWVKKVKITEPAAPSSDSFYAPRPDHKEHTIKYEGGQEISYRTLTRFMGSTINFNVFPFTYTDDPRGFELYVRNAGATPIEVEPVRNMSYIDGNPITEERWASAHLRLMRSLWGDVASTLKFDIKGIGVEPFGKSNLKAPKIKGTFGKYDLGEFPLHRSFDSAVGLLFGPDPKTNLVASSEYLVYEIEQTPGGDSKISAIELYEVAPVDLGLDLLPLITAEPPPPPPYNPPPNITIDTPLVGATLAGSVGISMTATDNILVKRVKVYIDGVFKANAVNTVGTTWDYTWDTTTSPDGGHLIQARAEDEEGDYGYADCHITVNN